MITVGVSRVHNSAVALLKDGELIFQLENERLSNIKYDAYPFHALSLLPKYVDKVDQLAIAGVGPTVPIESFTDHDPYTVFVARLNKKFFNNQIKTYNLWAEHHKTHAACAFYNSGFKEALCIIKDGAGSEYYIEDDRFQKNSYGRESSTAFISSYPANFQEVYKHVSVPFTCNTVVKDSVTVTNNVSEALAFQATAIAFGFHTLDAGKVMGLASYGVLDENIPKIYSDDGFINNNLFCIEKGVDSVYINFKDNPYLNFNDFQIKANFAFALQKATQEKIKQEILHLLKITGQTNLCLSGGYFLNCVANYEFLKSLPNNIQIYVEPISSDAGTALGSAKLIWHETTLDTTVRPQTHLYHGPVYNFKPNDIKAKLINEKIKLTSKKEVAELIANKNIVAMFQSRSESGPRALGNRSILYDPRDPNGKDFVNNIKKREQFRPFAGSVLEEHASFWFNMLSLKSSPYMMYAVDVLLEKQNLIPCITHVDGTCRVQTVNQMQNENFYGLIEEFYNLTGVPILFNTSFNLAGDCIVETIDDALLTLRNSDLKYLYLPEIDSLISKI
jgi:carbamoyltransferase